MIQIDMEMPKNCKFCPLDDVNPDQCPIRTIYKDDYATSRFTDCPLYKIAEDTDTISRQALCEYALNQKDKSITPNDIMRFPPAQPKKRTEERTETHACDLISRQAAIDAVYKCSDIFAGDMPVMVVKADAYEALAQLPSAEPELPEWAQKVEEYRKSAPSFVRNQLVWALYQTWKEYDGQLVHQRGKENR